MAKTGKTGLTRREFVKAAGIGVVAAGVAPTLLIPGKNPQRARTSLTCRCVPASRRPPSANTISRGNL